MPGSQDIGAAITLRGAAAPQCSEKKGKVLQMEQRVSPGEPVPSGQCPKCGALCHLEAAGATASSRAMPPTIVLFVKGGAVQGVEGDAPVRVILCDFDFTDGPKTVAGRPCHIGVWDSPDEPGDEFREALRLAGADAEGAQEEAVQQPFTQKGGDATVS